MTLLTNGRMWLFVGSFLLNIWHAMRLCIRSSLLLQRYCLIVKFVVN